MSSGKKLSILKNHFHNMLIAMLGGTGARVVTEIENIHCEISKGTALPFILSPSTHKRNSPILSVYSMRH
jgi:hypothetical protein